MFQCHNGARSFGRLYGQQCPDALKYISNDMKMIARECVNYESYKRSKMAPVLTMLHGCGKKEHV